MNTTIDTARINPFLAYPAKIDPIALKKLCIVWGIQKFNGVDHVILSARDWRIAIKEGAAERLDIVEPPREEVPQFMD